MNARRNRIQISLLCVVLLQAVTSGAQPVTKIAVGGPGGHSLFLKSDGSLWAMGDDEYGQLGDGTNITGAPYGVVRPEQIVASNVTAIAAGYFHSLFLKSDGSLWSMGDNDVGELGDGTTNNINQPEQIVASSVTAIAAGDGFSVFTKSDGSLWYMGFKGYGHGQQYNGNGYPVDPSNYTTVPQQIVSSGVTAIAAGYGHILFVKNDGSLWVVGYNGAGQFGNGTYNSSTQPEQIVGGGVTAIATGNGTSLFLKSDGSLWGMGYGGNGQLGVGVNSFTNSPVLILPSGSGITAIAEDVTDTILLTSDSSLWGIGESSSGQLGVIPGGGTLYFSPVQIVSGGVTTIAVGYQDTLFIKSDGSLWGMGDNEGGELGLGDYNGFNGSIFPSEFNQPVQIVAGPPGYNQISTIQIVGTNIVVTFPSIAAETYQLQFSSTLTPTNWVNLGTATIEIDGPLQLIDPCDASLPQGFYRVHVFP